jgi:hypothetical protein
MPNEDNGIESQSELLCRTLNHLTEAARHAQSKGAAQLVECQTLVSDAGVSLIFGGHFKSGKSTLLNMLIGKKLLPTGTLPETGVPCTLLRGAQEGIEVFRPAGNEKQALSTEGIRHLSSLLTVKGERRDVELDAHRIEVTAPWFPMAPAVKWVDAPGYNDTPKMNKRLADAARAGDLLVWVLSSQQILSTVEINFLSQFIAERGTSSVLFVLNIFLSEDNEEKWREYQCHFHRHIVQKVVDHAEEMGFPPSQPPIIHAVSARAQGDHPHNPLFGGDVVRKALLGISSPQHPVCLRSRSARCKLTVQAVLGGCKEDLKLLRDGASTQQQIEEQRVEERRETRREVLRDVDSALAAFWRRWPKVEAAVERKARGVSFDESYSTQEASLNEAFSSSLQPAIEALRLSLRRLQEQHDHSGKNRDLVEAHLESIGLGADLPVKPALPNTQAGHFGKVVGGALGLMLGPWGAALGVAVGGGVDVARQEAARKSADDLRSSWVSLSESRIRGDLNTAQERIEKALSKIRSKVEKVWLPDIRLEPDAKLASQIHAVQKMIDQLQAAVPELEVGIWRIAVRGWPDARTVAVAGNFNHWNTSSHLLERTREGLWVAELALLRGEYSYKFHVDGDWRLDPNGAPTRRQGGFTNNVATIS